MLKMVIRMDENKITHENRYPLDKIYRTIDKAFQKKGFFRMEDATGAMVYRDSGSARDYGSLGILVNSLKKQDWFMENVSVWLLCDSDDSEDENDFSEEDLLGHYRQKRAMGA